MNTLTIELTEREIRALRFAANAWAQAIDADQYRSEDGAPIALVTGALKLELALIAEGCEI